MFFFSPTYLLCLLWFINPESWLMLLTMSQCFAMCLDVVCAILVIGVAFGALILKECKYRCE